LCNGLSARSSLQEAIENMRWNAINWDKLTGSGEGPFVLADNASKSLRDKWQVVNYAREALWQRELDLDQKNKRCALFSESVGGVNLKTLCVTAAAASIAPDNFWNAMETNCWGKWNDTTQQMATEPVLGRDKCINSDNNTALNNLTGDNAASIDIDWDGTTDNVSRWEKWKLIDKAAEAVWNRSLAKTVRQNRCSNLSYDNASSSSDTAFDNVTTSLKDLCLTAVNSDGAVTAFEASMSNLTEGPFVNWDLIGTAGTPRIEVTGTQEWEKTYKLILDSGAVQYPSNSHWANDSRATDNTTFPGKWAVADFLQRIMWDFKSDWNPNGLTASEIAPRCEFFTETDNISTYCTQMPTYVEAKSVFGAIRWWESGSMPLFVNSNDSRIIRRSSNGYLFDDPQRALTLYTRVFPKETFSGSVTWGSNSTFNSEQVFAMIFTYLGGESVPAPSSPKYGDLESLSTNQKAWLNWKTLTTSWMDGGDGFRPLLNAFDNPSALR
jgi:hypothetical protein